MDAQGRIPIDRAVTTEISSEEWAAYAPTIESFVAAGGAAGRRADLGFDRYVLEHGEYPEAPIDLAQFSPFLGGLEGYEMIMGKWAMPESAPVVYLVQRDRALGAFAKLPSDHWPALIEPYDELEPPIGLSEDHETYILYGPLVGDVADVPEFAAAHPFFSSLINGLRHGPNTPSMESLGIIDLPAAPPAWDERNAKLGFFVQMLELDLQLAGNMHALNSSLPIPETLDEVTALLDSYNSSAWTNPFTEEPMEEVSVSEASLGNFTEIPTEEGPTLIFYYLDENEDISGIPIGVISSFELDAGGNTVPVE